MAYEFTPTGDLAVDLAHIYTDAFNEAPLTEAEFATAVAAAILAANDDTPYASGEFVTQAVTAATLLGITPSEYRGITASTVTDRITVTKAGVYFICADIYVQAPITCLGGLSIYINNAIKTYSWAAFNNGHATSGSTFTNLTVALAVGDYITFKSILYPGGTTVDFYGGAPSCWSVIKVG